MKVGLQLNM